MFAKLRNETRRRNPEVDLLKFNSRNRINWGRDPPPVWGRRDESLTREFIVANVAPVHLAIFARAKLFPG